MPVPFFPSLTNETGVVVEPASANIYKNPETNEYVDADITNKEVTVTVPGDFFNRTDNRYIEIKQGGTIRKEKTLITGDAVLEDYLNQQTTITFTEDFSGYTKDVDAVVSIYLTNTATKAVAEATINVVEMPFKLVFFKTDHLGSPRMVTDHDGTILTTHDFLAYGEELTDPDFSTNRMKFTGHERDPETGLDYMKARYYAAGFGRMLQVDPGYDYDKGNPMSFNLYGYVRGNPIMGTDPTGEKLKISNDEKTREIVNEIKGEDAELVQVDDQGNVSVDTSDPDRVSEMLQSNEGFAVIYDLVVDTANYEFSMSNTIETQAGVQEVDGVERLDNKPDKRFPQGKSPSQLPKKGVDGSVAISPTHACADRETGAPVNEANVAFHEMAESYARVNADQELEYGPAHKQAIAREKKLLKQRPGMTKAPAGGSLRRISK